MMKKLLILTSILLAPSAGASTIYANISNEYNLISFPYLSVKEVIGDKSKYEITTLASKEILLVPKARLGDRLDITLIASTGYSQFMSLIVKDMAPQKIEVPVKLPHSLLVVETKSTSIKADEFLQRIIEGKVQFEPIKKKGRPYLTASLRMHVLGTFTGEGMRAHLLELRNIGSSLMPMAKQSFNNLFPDTLKVHIPQPLLLVRGKMQIIIVTKT